MLLSWQELKVPQAYTILQQIMSHGKVIKNLGQAHSLKVYMISLLLSLHHSLFFVFTPFSAKAFVSLVFVCFIQSSWVRNVCLYIVRFYQQHSLQTYNSDPANWQLNLHCISQSRAHISVIHFISGCRFATWMESNGLTFFIKWIQMRWLYSLLKRCSIPV